MNIAKRKKKKVHKKAKNTVSMSENTKDFIQKICYKETASVDMTKYGFITDSKQLHFKYLVKPLQEQLVKILGNKVEAPKTKPKSKKEDAKNLKKRGSSSLKPNISQVKKKHNKLHFQKTDAVIPQTSVSA